MARKVVLTRGARWLFISVLLLLELWFGMEAGAERADALPQLLNTPSLCARETYRPLPNALRDFMAAADSTGGGASSEDFRKYLSSRPLLTIAEYRSNQMHEYARNRGFFYLLWGLVTLLLVLTCLKIDWCLKYVLLLAPLVAIVLMLTCRLRQTSPSMRYLEELEFLPPFEPKNHSRPFAVIKRAYEQNGRNVRIYLLPDGAASAVPHGEL